MIIVVVHKVMSMKGFQMLRGREKGGKERDGFSATIRDARFSTMNAKTFGAVGELAGDG